MINLPFLSLSIFQFLFRLFIVLSVFPSFAKKAGVASVSMEKRRMDEAPPIRFEGEEEERKRTKVKPRHLRLATKTRKTSKATSEIRDNSEDHKSACHDDDSADDNDDDDGFDDYGDDRPSGPAPDVPTR